MRKPVVAALAALAFAGPAGAATPALRLTIAHVVSGCHVWATAALKQLGATTSVTVERGTRLEIRPSCPMDFDFSQRRGPKVALGDPRTHSGTIRVIALRKPGLYVFQAVNVQSSAELGLQTLGADNERLTLIVRVT